MKQSMTKKSLTDFLEREFPQVSQSFNILDISENNFSMSLKITDETFKTWRKLYRGQPCFY